MNWNRPNQNKTNVPFISHSSVIENYSQISYLQENETRLVSDWQISGRGEDVCVLKTRGTT